MDVSAEASPNQTTGLLAYRFSIVAYALLLCSAVLLVYYPGLYGGFEFDDSSNIANNKALVIDSLTPETLISASLSGGIAGPLKRPISVATFIVNRYLTGLDPFYMKLTNIVIHILNSLSIFILSWLLLQTYYRTKAIEIPRQTIIWMAFALSALWALHPLALTSILYIVQRMTSISALFTIWGLIFYVIARQRMQNNGTGIALLIASFTSFLLLGAFSKENGLLLPLFTFVFEVTFFRFQASSIAARRFLLGFYIVVIALPILIAGIWLLFHTEWLLGGYKARTFTLSERLMTEARVLWFYLRLILLPDTSKMGIFHDDIPISHGLTTPWTTIPAIFGLFALAASAWILRHRLPILAFGILFFLVGHSMESSIFPLEITHEHRNYLPMYGIVFAAGFYILDTGKRLSPSKNRIIFMSILIALIAVTTFIRAGYWGNIREHALMEADNHPDSGRAQYQAGIMYWRLAQATPTEKNKEDLFRRSRSHFEKASLATDYQNDAYFALIQLSFAANFKMEQLWLDKLLTKLQQEPFPASTANMISVFTKCELNNICKLSESRMQNIFDAALKNPTLGGRSRAAVLSTAALYAANHNQYEKSLDYLYQATRSSGSDLFYRLTLIDLLIRLNRFAEAEKQLTIIKQEDKLFAYSQRIADKEKLLLKQKQLLQMTPKLSTKPGK